MCDQRAMLIHGDTNSDDEMMKKSCSNLAGGSFEYDNVRLLIGRILN